MGFLDKVKDFKAKTVERKAQGKPLFDTGLRPVYTHERYGLEKADTPIGFSGSAEIPQPFKESKPLRGISTAPYPEDQKRKLLRE